MEPNHTKLFQVLIYLLFKLNTIFYGIVSNIELLKCRPLLPIVDLIRFTNSSLESTCTECTVKRCRLSMITNNVQVGESPK